MSTERIYGTIKEIRIFKWGGFLILDWYRSNKPNQLIQCVLKDSKISDFKQESFVIIEGYWVDAKIKKELVKDGQEFNVTDIKVITEPDEPIPFNIQEKEISANFNTIFDLRQLSLRNEKNKLIFEIQNSIVSEFRSYLEKLGFIGTHTPKIVLEGAEGGSNIFKLDYFDKQAYLTQSPQFYKQMMCGVYGKVFEVGPVFRAEQHNTSRHINEYTSLDVEMILCDQSFYNSIDELINFEKKLLQSIFQSFENEKYVEKFKYLGIDIKKLLTISYAPVYTVSEVKEILGSENVHEHDLTAAEEIAICEHTGSAFVFVTHYHKEVRPFYTKVSGDGIKTESFDLLYKGMEITSGSVRKTSHKEYVDGMLEKGLNPENFKSYLNTFRYGMPPHGGFAIGLERLTAKICNLGSVKQATLFPRDVDRLVP